MRQTPSAAEKAVMEAAVEARKIAELDQRGFADVLGRDDGFVWKIESGERRVRVIDLIEIGWAAGVRPDSFIPRILSGTPLVEHTETRIGPPLHERIRRQLETELIAQTVVAREAVGKSQRRVAKDIGRSLSFVWKLEEGLRVKGLEIHDYLALSVSESFDPKLIMSKIVKSVLTKLRAGRS